MYATIVTIKKWPSHLKRRNAKGKREIYGTVFSMREKKNMCEVQTLGKVHKSQPVACLNSPLAVHCWLDTAQLDAPAHFSVSFSVCQGVHLQRF